MKHLVLAATLALTTLHCNNPTEEAAPLPKCTDYHTESFCAHEGNRIVLVDDSIPLPNRLLFQKGLEEWTAKTNGMVVFSVRFVPIAELQDNCDIPRTIYVWNRNPTDIELAGFSVWDIRIGSGVISIRPDVPSQYYTAITMHEVGHVLNIPHYEGKKASVMASPLTSTDLTCTDVISFCTVWHCDIPCCDTPTELHSILDNRSEQAKVPTCRLLKP